VLTLANKKFGYAAIPVAALIAFSRLYVFVHFPTDVLVGAILGIGLGLVVSIFGNKLFDKLSWLMTNKETPEK
jgi:undecaprenyl-diphosphatase